LFDEGKFRIFSYVDGLYSDSDTPGSGPHGDYEGSMRRPDWYVNQRAVYNGYKRLHGLHMLTVMLPTGINYVYGPNSARGGDMSAMVYSDLDEYLVYIQRNQFFDEETGMEKWYASHGDLLFPPGRCISLRIDLMIIKKMGKSSTGQMKILKMTNYFKKC
jgi:hypothetical protein